ncbi:hypothetical protein DFR56_106212 [Pseudogracilibacillus auburnensis]|uniref:Uncharacterized protein n=1 Tax=Pseudogracilibacillus auburnensis TaxID=1494959 RepID=A0A2V3VZ71_9BACI|nr:hypothetical protein DFR56_106212 [Pseudogracilibacillus auburnensis]
MGLFVGGLEPFQSTPSYKITSVNMGRLSLITKIRLFSIGQDVPLSVLFTIRLTLIEQMQPILFHDFSLLIIHNITIIFYHC